MAGQVIAGAIAELCVKALTLRTFRSPSFPFSLTKTEPRSQADAATQCTGDSHSRFPAW